MDVIHLPKVSAPIVFNSVPAHGDLADQAREVVGIYDVVYAPCEDTHRIAFLHGYNAGLVAREFEPSGKASKEIQALYKYLAGEMGYRLVS